MNILFHRENYIVTKGTWIKKGWDYDKKQSYIILFWLEKVHTRFIKIVIGVNNRTSNLAVYGEPGRFPLVLGQFKSI